MLIRVHMTEICFVTNCILVSKSAARPLVATGRANKRLTQTDPEIACRWSLNLALNCIATGYLGQVLPALRLVPFPPLCGSRHFLSPITHRKPSD